MDGQLLLILILRIAYCGVSPPASVSMRPEDMVECQRPWQEKTMIDVDEQSVLKILKEFTVGYGAFRATILYLQCPIGYLKAESLK